MTNTPLYVLTIDLGTTSVRAVLVNQKGEWEGMRQREFAQIFPKPGWVEHDPTEILNSLTSVIAELMREMKISVDQISGVGITNQRETTVAWSKSSGEPFYNAIVWQDQRTSARCSEIKKDAALTKTIREKTGLIPDSYFSASKMEWLINEVPEVGGAASSGDLLLGTIDSWIVWKLSNGTHHVTDVSNAARTMLYDIEKWQWDQELLKEFKVPVNTLPEVK
ncbi:MAG: glycerol kinase, partial [Flavobacteriales bacterium]|nr:glycerol kinase [Flavobacteriales bacterium]